MSSFRGFDHTAIVIEDTEESIRYYKETLGMEVASESDNFGIEHEQLNSILGARL
jgi:catechol 2,3-dioxygenase-like lactoylglutathione lyase family enzyme